MENEKELYFTDVNGVQLAYTVKGQGRPLIFLHGNGEEHSIFDETVQLLSPYFTCYSIDTRGHGSSSEVEEFHYQDMADDIDAFIRKFNLENVAVCGFSDGGIVALLLAMQNGQITDLIACGANLNPLGVKTPVLLGMRAMYGIKKDPKVYLMLSEPNIKEKQLAMIKARTLILAGQKDLIRYSHTKKIAEAIPGSTIRIIRGESHGSYIVHSDKLGRLLLKWFLRKKWR